MNCEICGKAATIAVSDLKEIPPSGASREWEPDDLPHFFCDEHARGPIRRPLPQGWQLKTAPSSQVGAPN